MAKKDESSRRSRRISWRAFLWWAAPILVLLGAVYYWRQGPGEAPKIDAGDPQQVALGEKVYAANCAQCHGANREGQPNWQTRKPDGKLPAPPQDATGHTWHHPDSYIFDVTKNGILPYAPPGYQSDMPAFAGKLSDDDIRAVIAFIESKWPPEIRKRRAAMNAMPMKGMGGM